ncbi:unnamed protein product [Owenia fusiformis]|uniref:Uncharacterized protein n=1 Tax=Owenia fusiformis TaxID=6347 RepID=A0A8J1UDW9_OWEFU|nr:unnamed protein product [Owenia fusiformis]
MSVNRAPNDMGSRNAKAREAGEILYNSLSNSNNSSSRLDGRSNTRNLAESSIAIEGGIDGRVSAVRRTFCLIILFDLLFSFILWVLYSQFTSKPLMVAIYEQVEKYSIRTSLFDTVLAAASRFTILILSYALFRSRKPWFVAITTALTCGFLVAKAFLFQFDKHNALDYIVLIVSFLITWIETWFMDFKVLPREQKARERAESLLGSYPNHIVDERTPLLGNNMSPGPQDDNFISLPGSDDEDSQIFGSLPTTRGHSRSNSRSSAISWQLGEEEQQYLKVAKEASDTAWRLYQATDGWKEENVKNDEEKIYTKVIPNIGKIFKSETIVDADAEKLFGLLWNGVEAETEWNPTVTEVQIAQTIDDHTDITYHVAAEAAGGMVSARDFVNLRTWRIKHGCIFSAGCSVEHKDYPANPKYVRGENGPGGWVFEPIDGQKGRCRFTWILNTMPKGWLPQYLVDQALSGVMLLFIKNLKIRVADVEKS